MLCPSPRPRVILLAVLLLGGVAQADPPTPDPWAGARLSTEGPYSARAWTLSLRMALIGVDRLEIGELASDPAGDDSGPLVDAAAINDLVTGMTFEARGRALCRCLGSHRLVFTGPGRRVELSLDHEGYMRWFGGAWHGEARLDPAGRAHVARWFAARGLGHPADGRAR